MAGYTHGIRASCCQGSWSGLPCDPNTYHSLQHRPQHAADLAQEAAVGRGGMDILIRSSEDPYIAALELTNGTLSFGPSSKGDAAIFLTASVLLGLDLSSEAGK